MSKKKFTSADLFCSEFCHYIRYNIKHNSIGDLKDTSYSIKGSGTSIVASFFTKGSVVLETFTNKNVISFNIKKKEIVVSPTITLSELYEFLIPYGLYIGSVPSFPGASIGGCVAANVHGQNHIIEGCFINNIIDIVLFNQHKGIINISRNINEELFDLTVGGYGVTGVIHEVRLRLIEIKSTVLDIEIIKFNSLLEGFKIIERESLKYDYIHSWFDLSVFDKKQHKGFISLGKFSKKNKIVSKELQSHKGEIHNKLLINIFGTMLIKIINKFYFYKNTYKDKKERDLYDFIFPSKNNLFYFSMFGTRGIIEHQVLIPFNNAETYLDDLISIILHYKPIISLCHLKVFRGKSSYVRFDGNGYCLGIHLFNNNKATLALQEIDKINNRYKCKVNLIKDSRIGIESIEDQYEDLEIFRSKVKENMPYLFFTNSIINKLFNKK